MPITPATGTGCAVSVTGQTPTTTSTTSVTPTTTTGPAATTSTVTSTTLGTILPLSSCPDARAAAAVQAAVDSDCNCRGAKTHQGGDEVQHRAKERRALAARFYPCARGTFTLY